MLRKRPKITFDKKTEIEHEKPGHFFICFFGAVFINFCHCNETASLARYPDVLEGLSSFTFFFSAPTHAIGECKKKKEIAIQALEKFGLVVKKEFPLQEPFEKGNKMCEMITSPSLSFELSKVEDMKGEILPILQATLTLEAVTTIEKNKAFCHSVLWSQKFFIKADSIHAPEAMISQSLSLLLNQFEKDYLKANRSKPTIYFPN